MEKILREVLAEDKSLLCRRDELTAALEKKVPANLMRDFTAIKKALSLNVGEKFFVGAEDKEALKAEVAEMLKDGGLQAARIDFVINTFVKALDWDKPLTLVEEKFPNAEPTAVEEKISLDKKPTHAAPPPQPTTPQTPPKQSKPLNLSRPQSTPPRTVSPPPPQPPPQPPTTPPSQPSQGVNKNIIIGILCVVIFAMFFMTGKDSDNTSNSPSPPAAAPAAESPPTQSVEQTAPAPPPEDRSYLNARTELSLNGMDLDISVKDAEKILGRPREIKNVDGYDRYIYSDNFYIAVHNGKVDAFVTYDPKYKTLRGLHAGSTYGEVVDKYGTNSSDMNLDNLVLHEYSFTSLEGRKGLLRFAVNPAGRVDYISIRIVEEPAPTVKPNKPLGKNWIKDSRDIYLWNPEPQDGETISWSGGYVQDGEYKFANGSGVVKWFRYGELIQVDEGTFEHGRHHGRFKHTFRSGNVEYSNWNHGQEI